MRPNSPTIETLPAGPRSIRFRVRFPANEAARARAWAEEYARQYGYAYDLRIREIPTPGAIVFEVDRLASAD